VSYYVIVPIFSLILLIFQTTILNLFVLGKMSVEISLIVVIYAGFRLSAMKGGFLAFITGFLLDCLTGSASGLFTVYYVLVFVGSRILSLKIYSEGYWFIAAFTVACAFFEAIFITLIYHAFYEVEVFWNIYKVFFAQALVAGLLSPALFKLCERLEGIFNVREAR
jgi:rod shape-determining protein MreD